MGYEVDFLAVGNGARSGDAILMRWGNLNGGGDQQTVVVVDGGFDDDADKIIGHMESYYKTDRVDLVVSTHPDADHVNGLRGVLRKADVKKLWMHQPWNHVNSITQKNKLKNSLGAAYDLEQIAVQRGILIEEPFSGITIEGNAGLLQVVGPTDSYYEELIPSFEALVGTSAATRQERSREENWWTETLDDKGETTAENNSSSVLGFQYSNSKILLTGDAGIPALNHVADFLQPLHWLQNLRFVQVPHHGSKRNVGPDILNRILGSIVRENNIRGTAFVSCAPDGRPKHPHKKVTNAFKRRGFPVVETAGKNILHRHDTPQRPGWVSAQYLPLYPIVED